MIKLTENGSLIIDHCFFDKEDLLNMNRLQRLLILEENELYTIEECINIWGNYSNDLAATWLFMDNQDEAVLSGIRISNGFHSFEEWSK